jgi:RND family efflux transporter MFP subunit
MKTFLKSFLPVLVLALAGGVVWLMIHFRKEVQLRPVEVLPPLVNTVVARSQDYQFRVETQGTVRPRTEIQVVPEVSGRVVSVSPSLDAGGFFEEGEVLLALDSRDFELAVTRAQAQVAEARYRLEFEQADAAVARREWEKLGQGKPSPLLLHEPQVAQAEATLSSAEAALEQARRDLDRCQIKAPFAGRVGQKSVDVGQYVTKGSPVARIYSVDYAEVRLPLSADQLAYVNLPLDYRGETHSNRGPEVLLKASLAGQTHVWSGTIDRTEGEIDTRTRMIFAVAQVKNPYGRGDNRKRPPLASGLFVDAEILGKTATNVVVVPRSALRGPDRLLVVDSENRLRFREVNVLRAGREEVIIRSGLKDGERICTSPLDVVVDGMKVRTEGGTSAAEAKS